MPESVGPSPEDSGLHGGEVFEVARQLKVNPERILDFSASINPLGPPLSAIRRMKASLKEISHYPDLDCFEFRKAVASFVGRDYENIIEGNGSTELIYLFTDFAMGPGERAVIPVPAFSEYARAVRRRGGTPIYVPCRPDFALDVDGLSSEIERGCKLLFLASPGNPSSRLVPTKEMLSLVEDAADRGTRVILDEAFIEFIDGSDAEFSARVEEFPNLLVIRSLTKVFALAGLRVGYGIGASKVIAQARKGRIPWSVSIPAQEAAIAAVEDRAFLRRTRRLIAREKQFLHDGLAAIEGVNPVRPDANFVLAKLPPGHGAGELKSALLSKLILIRDCSSFEGLDQSYFRVCVKLRKENEKLLSALRTVLK